MASSNATAPHNYSLHAIPVSFGLAFVPHTFYLVDLMLSTRGKMSMSTPRTNMEAWRSKISTDVWNRMARARGAHINALEVFPLFAAAALAGNMAKMPTSDLNSMSLQFLGARVVYTALYLGVKSNTWALARTGVYYWSISIPIMALWRAGNGMAEV